ncbi:hypothetical protein V8G54_003961 [Vigna mungo]|uniref:Glucosidase II beta subunit N-terminal domain-containing protein n=1 Tax=Vigna mungo TaxID=3915 RepID=A0AAQ3PEL5_VIGMU
MEKAFGVIGQRSKEGIYHGKLIKRKVDMKLGAKIHVHMEEFLFITLSTMFPILLLTGAEHEAAAANPPHCSGVVRPIFLFFEAQGPVPWNRSRRSLPLAQRNTHRYRFQFYLHFETSADDKYYRASDVIRCKDGSGKFTKAQLNDDFCDCADGTDEPGTSACPAGRFFCRNAGHSPVDLFSSRVNDGICDCCDGTDEYDGKVKCPNTCWEAGKVARNRLEKKIATYEEGVKLRKQEIEQAKVAIKKDEAELSQLKKEENHKEQIEKAEEKERLQKEKEEMQKKESEKKADEIIDKTDEDMENRNEAGKHSELEDNDVENNQDKIANLEGSHADQNLTVQLDAPS